MPSLTTLQAAVRCGVHPSVIRSWVAGGVLEPTGRRSTGTGSTYLFDERRLDALCGVRPAAAPVEALAAMPAPSVTEMPGGLLILEAMGRFKRASFGGNRIGGGELLGQVLIGTDWLRVFMSDSGIVFHEQAEWMEDDPDWMESAEYAEMATLLVAA